MTQYVVGHAVIDGWEVRFLTPGISGEQVQHFDSQTDGVKWFLANRKDTEVTSIRFYAKRVSAAAAQLDLQDHMGEFYEKTFSAAEVMALPESWLGEMRQDVSRVDNEQMAKFVSITQRQQAKVLEMALGLFTQNFDIGRPYQKYNQPAETRHFPIRCVACKEIIDIPLIQKGENIWGAVVQMKVMQHLEAKHKN